MGSMFGKSLPRLPGPARRHGHGQDDQQEVHHGEGPVKDVLRATRGYQQADTTDEW